MSNANYITLLSLLGNTSVENLPLALVSDAKLSFLALAEIHLRNPTRIEGATFSFSRRDRGVGTTLATKFLNGEELTAEDVLAGVNLAYRYRKQIAKMLPTAQVAENDNAAPLEVEITEGEMVEVEAITLN
jgi:predicted transcriptional regulator